MKTLTRLSLVLFTVFFSGAVYALEVGDTGPCVVLRDLQTNGKVIQQCIRTPKKPGEFVVIDFFHPKCDECVENLENLGELARDVERTATTRLVGSDRDEAELKAFLEEHKSAVTVPVSLDTKLQAMRAYGVDAVPTLFVLNSRNKILFKHVGGVTPEVSEQIKKLVK